MIVPIPNPKALQRLSSTMHAKRPQAGMHELGLELHRVFIWVIGMGLVGIAL